MGNGLFAGESLLGIKLHEVADEILGRIRYLIPVRGIKLIVTTHYLVKQLCIILMVEWRVATQPTCIHTCTLILHYTCAHTCTYIILILNLGT